MLPPTPKDEIPHPHVTRGTRVHQENRDVLMPGIDDGPRWFACGEQRLAGKGHFAHYDPFNDNLWVVIEFGCGEFDGLIEVTHSDGRPIAVGAGPFGYWEYWWYAGTAAGQVDTHLQAVLASWNEAFPGTCYAMVVFRQFGTYWTAKVPDLTWRMRTRKVLIPETGLYAYSTNVWDQFYDYVRHAEGKALPATRVNTAAFVAAKAADAAAGRNTDCHLLLMSETSPDDVIKTLQLIARALWVWDSNQWTVIPDRPGSSVATYDDSIVSDRTPHQLRRRDTIDRPNKITVFGTDVAPTTSGGVTAPGPWTEKPYSFPEVDPAGDIIEEVYHLPHVHDFGLLKTIAVWLYNSRVFDISTEEFWLPSTSDRKVGDIVTRVYEEYGLTIPFRIVGRTKSLEGFTVRLSEYNAAKFAEYAISDPPKIASTVPHPGQAPEAPGEFFNDGGGVPTGVWWNAPPLSRVPISIPSGNWSGTNMTTLVASALADGNESVTAALFGASGTTRSLVVQVPSGQSVAEWRMTFGADQNYGGGAPAPPTLYWADSAGGPWTALDGNSGGPAGRVYRHWVWQVPAAFRSKLHWKWETSTGYAIAIAEIRALSFSGANGFIEGYLLTKLVGRDPAGSSIYETERILFQPSSSRMIPRTAFELEIKSPDPLNGGYSSINTLRRMFVQTIGKDGQYSEPRLVRLSDSVGAGVPVNATGIAQSWVPQTMQDLTLSNGVNSNIATTLGPGMQRVKKASEGGPSGNYGLGGFVAPIGIVPIMGIYETEARTVTVHHQHASSTAANRIIVPSGFNESFVGPAVLWFTYDFTAQRYVFMGGEDATIIQQAGNVGIGPGVDPASARLTVLAAAGTTALQVGSTGGYNRMTFNSPSTGVGGVINRASGADIYFGETADTGSWIFRGSGPLKTEGKISAGATPAGAGALQTITDAVAKLAKVGGAIFERTSSTGNSGAGEDDLLSESLTAGMLGNNGAAVFAIAAGLLADNSQGKRLRVRLIEGANNNLLFDHNVLTAGAGSWLLLIGIIRTGATTARCIVADVNSLVGTLATYTAATVTWANAATLKITAECTNPATSNDLTLEMAKGFWTSAA